MALVAHAQESTRGIHRLALISFATQGKPGMDSLPGARKDAQSMAQVLQELGGVASNDVLFLDNPDTASIHSAFRKIGEIAKRDSAAGIAVQLVFHHSGHANSQGLLLGNQILLWSQLRAGLQNTKSRIRILFLDACASGTILRTRGGRLLTPASNPVQGEAWLVSSRPEEASLESDEDGGGIFTRILAGGLRGAADRDRDGAITFEEIVQHTTRSTNQRAQSLGGHRQTPQWASSLQGDAPLVLTRIQPLHTTLLLSAHTTDWLIHDSLAAPQAWIPADTNSSRIALAPGLYTVYEDSAGVRKAVRFRLRPSAQRWLASEEFLRIDSANPNFSDTTLHSVPVNFGLLSPLTLNGKHPERATNNFSFDLILSDAGRIRGFQWAGFLTRVHREVDGVQLASVINLAGGPIRGFQFSTVNLVEQGVHGAQLGLALNLNEGDSRTAQFAGVLNVNRGELKGTQVAAGACYAGNLVGAQLSLLNIGSSVRGTQIGLVNIADQLEGAQIGLINIAATSKGVMAGLLNVSPNSDAMPLGLIHVGSSWSVHPMIGWSTSQQLHLQIRTDSKFGHSLVLAENPHTYRRFETWGLGAGIHGTKRIRWELSGLLLTSTYWDSLAWGAQVGLDVPIYSHLVPSIKVIWRNDKSRQINGVVGLAF